MLVPARLPYDVDDLLPETRPGARQGLAAAVGRAVDHASGPRSTPRGCVQKRLCGVGPGFRFSQAGRGATDLTPAKPSDLSHRVEAIRENPLTGSDPAKLAPREAHW